MNAQRVEAALAAEIRAGTYLLALSPSEIEAIIAAADEAVGGVVPRDVLLVWLEQPPHGGTLLRMAFERRFPIGRGATRDVAG